MQVRSVTTLGFRNLEPADFELGDGITLLHGPNGSGKTNLLESLYTGLVGRSCRTSAERELIAFGEPLARVEVAVDDDERSTRSTFLWSLARGGEKRQLLDGTPVGVESPESRPALSVFMPDRLTLIKGPPAARRSHLDRFVAALRPSRAEARRRYARALGQRNALVSRIRRGEAGEASLDAWDLELAGAGVELIGVRAEAVARLEPLFSQTASELGLDRGAEISYRPRSEAGSSEELLAELRERRASDLGRGFSGHGPHLDELVLRHGGRSLRQYGSQGQQRTALLALLFAERDALLAERAQPPMILLDDVTSELDPQRRELLCTRLLAGGGQALITATEAAHLPDRCPRMELAVGEGRIGARST